MNGLDRFAGEHASGAFMDYEMSLTLKILLMSTGMSWWKRGNGSSENPDTTSATALRTGNYCNQATPKGVRRKDCNKKRTYFAQLCSEHKLFRQENTCNNLMKYRSEKSPFSREKSGQKGSEERQTGNNAQYHIPASSRVVVYLNSKAVSNLERLPRSSVTFRLT